MDLDDFDDFGEDEREEKDQLDPNNPEHAFLIIERDFNKTVAEIEQNPAIATYAEEFNKLFEALYESNETKKELTETCSQLEKQLSEGTEKLVAATKIVQADAEVIQTLKDKINDSWKMTDAAHEREQQAQEIIDNLRSQINALTVELEFKSKMASDGDDGGAANKNQEGLEREKEKLLGEVAQLQQKLANALGYQEELERKNSQADFKIVNLSTELEELGADFDKVKKQRDKLESDAVDLNFDLNKCNNEIKFLQNTVHKGENLAARLDRQISDLKYTKERLLKELDDKNEKHRHLQENYKELSENNEETTKQLAKSTLQNKLKEDQNQKMQAEIDKFSLIRERYDKKLIKLDFEKQKNIQERDKLMQNQLNAEKEILAFKKQSEMDRRTIDSVIKEKDILTQNIMKHQALVKEHIKLMKIQEQSKKKLESEIEEHVYELGKQRKQMNYLEKERDRLVEEGLDLTQRIEDTLDEVKTKKAELFDLKKTLTENESKLRTQQNLFETIRAERNNLLKTLQETTTECGELKSKLKISSHQSEQLKEDISMKERELIREENILRKMTKEKEKMRAELDNAIDTIRELKNEIGEMKVEEKRYLKVIDESDRKIKDQAKDLETLQNERDILGSQLVRRNDELALLYEKIQILQSTLQRGEAHYERRLDDIRLLKIEVKRLRQEKFLLSKSITNMTDLRQEIFHLERDYTRERLKCRALEEELQNPLNIHRWRKLEGSDPEVLDLLKKVQLLQKRLLRQTSQAVERERQLKETQKLYTNLKSILSKQPGPETQNDLAKTRKALALRGSKMKCLVSELNMTELQVVEYKEDLDKIREELKMVKKKYLMEKKAHRKDLELLKLLEGKDQQRFSSEQIKFSGGGYKMALTNN
ncbi:hypothetical protein RN001_011690 [Aquatica leii]|uniref:Cilia- and flagella-associated protein 58 central coiled coil domain-containing protein n=1 Tax=Aquatica leii TaxID=1421715 RepID=A0AAN7QE20_9COLE|nr:hypothetical protein RN001_011690 [Aquatica leii]